MIDWKQYNSPDFFTSACTHTYSGVPTNNLGYSNASQGSAYVGISVYQSSEYKEYFYQQLSSTLEIGKIYCLSFYTSRADRNQYAIKQIGAYFTSSLPNMVSSMYINAIPQVVNNSTFIADTTQWIQIQGCFTAQGGEQYVIFGNFNSNNNTDTLYAGTNNPDPNYPNFKYSYYYFDDITLIDQTTVGVNELNVRDNINLYPNPNNGNMTLDYDLGSYSNAKVNLCDVTGKIISTYKLSNTKGILQMNEQNLNNGIYFYSILVGEKTIKTDKLVIIK